MLFIKNLFQGNQNNGYEITINGFQVRKINEINHYYFDDLKHCKFLKVIKATGLQLQFICQIGWLLPLVLPKMKYGSVKTIINDLCKVNMSLANEIGSCWGLGQAFYIVHFTLAIAQGIKSVLETYPSYIGSEKHFPQSVSLECIQRTILLLFKFQIAGWQEQAWNKYVSQILLKNVIIIMQAI